MAIINHNSISGVTTVSVGSSIVVGDTFVITSNGLENITQISATGVITATSFSGALTGNVTGSATALSGTPDITVGTLNVTDAIISGDLTVQGTTTTLDTVVTEVDKLEVDANNTTVGVAITQSGTGDILRLYDSATQVVTVTDGGSVGIGTDNPNGGLEVYNSNQAVSIVRGNKATLAILGDDSNSGASDTDARIILCGDGTIANSVSALTTSPLSNHGFEIALINEEPGSGLRFHDGTANAERLRIDSSGRIGIGTEDPTAGTDGESDDLVIHRASGAAGMTIKTAANVTGAIRFADPDGASQGRIEYNHSSDYLRWNTGGSEKLRLDSSGNLSFAADTDTYIGRPSSDTLALTTGGTERLRIASDGQATFDKGAVGGANQVIARFQAESSRRLDIVWHDSGSLMGFDTPSNHSYIFKTNGTERLRIGSSGQIGLGGANYGTSGQVLTSQGSGSAPQWATLSTDAQSVAILTDVKTQGTTGGTFTSGAWQVRDLNTEAYDPDGIVTLSSNQFTLVSGTYYVWWSAPGYTVTRHQSRLWNVNGNNQEELGDSVYTPSSVQVPSQGAAIVSNGTYRIEHRCQTTQSGNGFGVEANFTTERYTRVVIIKIG